MKNLYLKFIIFYILISLLSVVYAQDEYVMDTVLHKSAVSDYCHIYDDGGKTGNYNKRVYGAAYTVTSSNPNARFRIIWDVKVNSNKNKSLVEILDGDDNSTANITNIASSASKGRLYSNSNTVTVRFTADDDFPSEGFDILLIACECTEPENIVMTNIDENTAVISWDSQEGVSVWTVDYVVSTCDKVSALGDLPNVQTVQTSDTFVVITGFMTYNDCFVYDIYGDCGDVTGCGAFNDDKNPCPDIDYENLHYEIDTASKTVTFTWDEPSDTILWYFYDGTTTIIDTNFFVYEYETCGTKLLHLASGKDNAPPVECTPNFSIEIPCPCGHFTPDAVYIEVDEENDLLKLYCDSNDSVLYWVFKDIDYGIIYNEEKYLELPLTCRRYHFTVYGNVGDPYDPCDVFEFDTTFIYPCETVKNLIVTEVEANTIAVEWETGSENINSFLVECYDKNTKELVYQEVYNTTSALITDLLYYEEYVIKVSSVCPNGKISCPQTVIARTAYDNCLDFVNLKSPNIMLTFGTYDNPYANLGYATDNSRFRVYNNPDATDQITGMQIIPQGEKAVIRLGNPNVGKNAESITYNYFVDTAEVDMLLLKYAVVLEDPGHDMTNQPRFTLEILDENYQVLDAQCGYVNFYAAGDLGWNKVGGNSTVIWKDWTAMGINISQYHNQTVKIRFTTYDCNDGGHFGYAYYNIRCAKKRIAVTKQCVQGDSVTLSAPYGFNYSWYKEGSFDTISHNQTINVAADNSEYHCLLRFLGKTECDFELTTYAVNLQPKAKIGYTIDTCHSRIYLKNESFVNYDDSYNVYVPQTADTAVWITPNGETYTGNEYSFTLTENTVIKLKLKVFMSDSYCADSTEIEIPIDFLLMSQISAGNIHCKGEALVMSVETYDDGVTCVWSNGETGKSITVYPDLTDTLYYVTGYLNGKCIGTSYFGLKIGISYNNVANDTICSGQTYTFNGFNESESGQYIHKFTTDEGCDSIWTLNLTVMNAYYDTLHILHCDSGYYDNGFNVQETGIYQQNYQTANGCDSILVLDFVNASVFVDTITANIYKGKTYRGFGFEESQTGLYTLQYTDINGCDSIYILNLNVSQLQFPTAITPNGDGINDIFEIKGLLEQNVFDNTLLIVYNRYGKEIFRKENIKEKTEFWNPDDSDAPTGTYFYRFIATGKDDNMDFSGSVEVLR